MRRLGLIAAVAAAGSPYGMPAVTLTGIERTGPGAAVVSFAVDAPEGLRDARVGFGSRQLCRVTAPPFRCAFAFTAGDVGTNRVVVRVTDAQGRVAVAERDFTVPRFAARVRLAVGRAPLPDGRVRRTVTATVRASRRLEPAEACAAGKLRFVIARGARKVVDERVSLEGTCAVRASVVAPAAAQGFRARAAFGGSNLLRPAREVRTFP